MFQPSQSRRFLAKGLSIVALAILASGATFETADAGRRHQQQPADDDLQNTLSGSPIMAVVSIRDQRVTVYDAAGGTMSSRVSSGRTDYETPVGVYSVLQKEEEHFSNIYDDASMPFMQRITWSGIALHSGQLPGYPASHGCVRMPDGFAQRLFPLTNVGMRVVIAYDDAAPAPISHPLLMKPTPPQVLQAAAAIPTAYVNDNDNSRSAFEPDLRNWPARQAEFNALKAVAANKQLDADSAIAQAQEFEQAIDEKKAPRDRAARALRKAEAAKKEADDRLDTADKRLSGAKSERARKEWQGAKDAALKRAEQATAKVAAANDALKAAEDELKSLADKAAPTLAARDAAVAAAKAAKFKSQPISVFISLKTQRLYVRQGYEPVFDAPVTISEPDKPIGTHVFTAFDYANGGNDVRWTAVSLTHRDSDYALNDDGRRRLSDADIAPAPTDVGEAKAALDRITIPADVEAKLASAVWPGSSVIISDEPMSKETGKSTDFIVLVSTEPQGGIKKRPKQFFRNDYFMSDSADDFYYGYGRNGRRQMYPRQRSYFGWW